METIENGAQVTPDRSAVTFAIMHRGHLVECLVTTTALEAWFWLEAGATNARILKTFNDGYWRIRSVAERKLLARPALRLELSPDDFAPH